MIKDPTSDVSLPRQTYQAQSEEESVEAFTDEQCDEIFNELNTGVSNSKGMEKLKNQQVMAFCELMLAGGFRTDELWNINFGDVQLKGSKHLIQTECKVNVRISKTGPRVTLFMSP